MLHHSIFQIPIFVLLASLFSCGQQQQITMQKDTTHQYTNHLIHETSPYLLQHAHNPVNWYPWSEEALEKAKRENKPLLVSIGYSACHWCHVMEHESFEDTAVAKLMNENFVCIKIDREERPDIDQIYMDALQAMTGSGGWPLNMFLTPEQKPFYGGTYFPPHSMYNRPSWTQVLQNISKTFKEKRKEVDEQADKLMAYLEHSDTTFVQNQTLRVSETLKVFNKEQLGNIFSNIMERADKKDGGFGAAPKFPSTMSIQFLLRYFYFTSLPNPSPENIGTGQDGTKALEQATLSLDKMIMGGIYDQLGGGFARYSTDKEWLVPHFEKMLYDNALLVDALVEAYQIIKISPTPTLPEGGGGRSELYKETIEETLGFVMREMTSEEGGFYAAQNADSEGEEGKYYVWSKNEIDSFLGEKAKIFCEFYDVSEKGNWEEKNILNRKYSLEEFMKKQKSNIFSEKDLKNNLKQCREILFKERNKRVKPGLDDKIILGWNALMCSAFAEAYKAIPNEEWKKIAERNIIFILEKFRSPTPTLPFGEGDNAFYHTYKNGKANYPAFLDDYAFLIDALINVYGINQNEHLLIEADKLTEYVLENFYDEKDGMFFYTSEKQKDVLMRKKDFYDNAIPSGISMMAKNLQRLAIIFDKPLYTEKSVRMMQNILPTIEKYSASFSQWANVLVNYVYPIKEIAVAGDDYKNVMAKINGFFIPNKVMMGFDGNGNSIYPLLKDKKPKEQTLIYVCENYACKKPVASVEEAKKLLFENE